MDRRGAMERSLQPATVRASSLGTAFGESRLHLAVVALFSAFVNLLMLTGPVFMLQVYDRVLTSRSEATLVALVGIVAFLFLMMGLLDHFRARVLARAGARFQDRLDARVLGAIMARAGHSPHSRSAPASGLHDLEAIQRFASNPGAFAFFDVPWTPVFVLALFTFHWMLGLFAVLSGVALLALALLNQMRTASIQEQAGRAAAVRGLAGARRMVIPPLLTAFALLGTHACTAQSAAAPILLSCAGAGGTDKAIVGALCDALEAEMHARAPDRPLRRLGPDEPGPAGAWRGVLEVVRTEPSIWEGRLLWEVIGDEGAGRTAGPFVQTSSVDAPLGAGAYRDFARGIVKTSWPKF